MPDYVSAYEWQQRNGLTRQQVIELAEIGPTYWKAEHSGFFPPEGRQENPDNGFETFKGEALKIWRCFSCFCNLMNTIWEEMKRGALVSDWDDEIVNGSMPLKCFDQSIDFLSGGDDVSDGIYGDVTEDDYYLESLKTYREMPRIASVAFQRENKAHPDSIEGRFILDLQEKWATSLSRNITKILPLYINGQTAHRLFAWGVAPDVYLKKPDDKYKLRDVLDKMLFQQLLCLFEMPENTRTDGAIWEYLTHFHDEDDSQSAFLDLFFQIFFTKRLFFDRKNLPQKSAVESVPLLAIEDLPKLYCTKNFAPKLAVDEPEKRHIERTLEIPQNQAAAQNIAIWLNCGRSPEEIALELKKNGGGTAVIGVLLKPDTATKEGARNAAQRLLGQKK